MLWKVGIKRALQHKDQPVKRSVAGRRVSLTGDEDAPGYEGREAVRYHPRKGGVWLISVSQANRVGLFFFLKEDSYQNSLSSSVFLG